MSTAVKFGIKKKALTVIQPKEVSHMKTRLMVTVAQVIGCHVLFLLSRAAAQTEYVWTSPVSGNWSAAENWQDGNAATGETGRAWFTNSLSANCAVTLDSSPWTVNSLVFSNSGAYAFSLTGGTLDLGGTTPTLTVNASSTTTVATVLSGLAGLTKADSGTLVLSSSNTYSGATVINAGTLKLQSAVLPAAVREWNADSLTGANGAQVTAWTDAIAGKNATTGNAAPTLAKGAVNGHNAVAFGGNQNLVVAAGDSSVSGASAFTICVVFKPTASGAGAGGSMWYQNSGLVDSEIPGDTTDWGLEWNGANQVVAGIGGGDTTRGSASVDLDVTHIAVYSWDGSTGLMTLNVDGAKVTQGSSATGNRSTQSFGIGRCMTSDNYFVGQIADIRFFNTALSDADINSLGYDLARIYGVSASFTGAAGNTPSLPTATSLAIASGGLLDLNGFSQTVQSLEGAGTVDTEPLATLTVAGAVSTTFSGSLNNNLFLDKTGAGTLTLSGTSTYRGTTLVEQGTLVAANAAALGTPVSPVTVNGGATLSVNAGSGSKGLAWVYYATTPGSQSTFSGSLANIQGAVSGLTPTRIVTATAFTITGNGGFPIVPYDWSQAMCSGLLKITTPGTYTFTRVLQDDDAAIFIDGAALIPGVTTDNATPWAEGAHTVSIDLNAGYHSLAIPWYQGYGGATLYVQWSGPDTNYNLWDLTTATATLTPDLYVANLGGAGEVALITGNLVAGFNNADSSFSGTISGIGGLSKWGGGALTLSGTNTYSGDTTVVSGTLTIGGAGLLGGGTYAGNLVNNGILNIGSSQSQTLSGTISGTGSLTKSGDGTLTLAGAGTYTGTTTVNGGALVLQAASLPSPVREWDADSLTGGDGSSVTAWVDQIAGKTATVLDAAPTLSTGAINGHNAVTFGGSQSLTVAGGDSSISGANAFTISVVFKPTASGSGSEGSPWYQNAGLVDSEQGGWQNDWGFEWNGANQVAAGIGIAGTGDATRASGAFDLSVAHVALYSWDAATGVITLCVDGLSSKLATGATSARNWASFAIGRCVTWPTGFFTGQIADIRFYGTALSGAEMQRASYALAQTYGITASAITRPGSLAATSDITLASGSSLTLSDLGQTVARVQGSGSVLGGTLSVTGTIAPGGAGSAGALSVASLTLAEGAVYDWNYGDGVSDTVTVSGPLTLPSVATVNVSRVTGSTEKLPGTAVLFSSGSLIVDAGAVKNWGVTGARADTHVSVSGNRVLLVSMNGTMLVVK